MNQISMNRTVDFQNILHRIRQLTRIATRMIYDNITLLILLTHTNDSMEASELGQSGFWLTGYPSLSQSLNLLSLGFDPGSL